MKDEEESRARSQVNLFYPDTSRYRRSCVKRLQTKCVLMSISKYQVMHSVLTCDALKIQKIKHL